MIGAGEIGNVLAANVMNAIGQENLHSNQASYTSAYVQGMDCMHLFSRAQEVMDSAALAVFQRAAEFQNSQAGIWKRARKAGAVRMISEQPFF
jgi:hypothetical protein